MEIIVNSGPKSRGIKTLQIDDEDFPFLSEFHLGAYRDSKNRTETWYGVARRKENGEWVQYGLGRLILGLPKGDKREAEHINPNATLDYRRSNLRIATRAQNNSNRRMRKDNTSGFKGVTACRDSRGGWIAQIMVDGRGINLGAHPTKESAYEVYCAAAKHYHGDFARPERRIDGATAQTAVTL